MMARERAERPVGVRELRQNLSVYLAQLKTGTVFRVTDRGHAVALLIPMPTRTTAAERLVAAGRASAPTRALRDLGAPGTRIKASLSDALREVRDDRL